MKEFLLSHLRFVAANWRTSLLGLVILTAYALWLSVRISTTEFVSVLAFVSSVGFFAMTDPKLPRE
jgi:hypothetical protein